jgi:hypothetical protein
VGEGDPDTLSTSGDTSQYHGFTLLLVHRLPLSFTRTHNSYLPLNTPTICIRLAHVRKVRKLSGPAKLPTSCHLGEQDSKLEPCFDSDKSAGNGCGEIARHPSARPAHCRSRGNARRTRSSRTLPCATRLDRTVVVIFLDFGLGSAWREDFGPVRSERLENHFTQARSVTVLTSEKKALLPSEVKVT